MHGPINIRLTNSLWVFTKKVKFLSFFFLNKQHIRHSITLTTDTLVRSTDSDKQQKMNAHNTTDNETPGDNNTQHDNNTQPNHENNNSAIPV